ncbi:MAG: flagellar biosynthetic protein FlhB [Alphaproteobacteria bacterium]|jgi:flagellar biosynthetic protein FlhB
MADDDDKTEEPTDRKLQKAREEGNVPKSEDFNGFLGLSLGILTLFTISNVYTEDLLANMGGCFESIFEDKLNHYVTEKCQGYLNVVIEISIITFISGIFGSTLGYLILSKGFVISKEPLKLNMQALDLGKNLTNLFNKENATSMAISIAKETLLYGSFFLIVLYFLPGIVYQTFCFENCRGNVPVIFIYVLVATYTLISFIFAAIDVPLKIIFWKAKLKMSHKDIKDEHKESEGSPDIKRAQNEFRNDLLHGSPAGPKNATFFIKGAGMIFGIRYNRQESPAPMVVAMGKKPDKANAIAQIASGMRRLIINDEEFSRKLGSIAVMGRPVPLEFVKDIRRCVMALQKHEQEFGPVHPAK